MGRPRKPRVEHFLPPPSNLPPAPTADAVLYARVSTDEQDYERQVADTTKYANRCGLRIVGTYVEKFTGYTRNINRAALQHMLAHLEREPFSHLVVVDPTRIGRNTAEALQLVEELHRYRVCIHVETLALRTMTAEGEVDEAAYFALTLMIKAGEIWLKNHRKAIRSGMEQARRNGVHIGRPQGSTWEAKDVLKKYRKLLPDLDLGLAPSKVAKIHEVSVNTVKKVRDFYAASKKLKS